MAWTSTTDKTAILIDAGNLSYMSKAVGFEIDFKRFRSYFSNSRRFKLQYIGYYTAVETSETGHTNLRPLLDMLSYNKYTIVEKPTKVYDNGSTRKVKGNMDIEITLGALYLVDKVDTIILVTGDGDFSALVRELRNRAVNVIIVASRQSNMLSEELRKCATEVIDLVDIKDDICRDAT